ncbi:hypothetical protein GIB67_005124 [Kingdonia uniflora]|uniref:NAC domain-containing protein n=1 Tax=Kingdonia uniflora TaxID=39325 RepID=A0A7J7NW48_9MAGN|nr:hypothetical protein GIB67_005124 [Kingdonia uniflora]
MATTTTTTVRTIFSELQSHKLPSRLTDSTPLIKLRFCFSHALPQLVPKGWKFEPSDKELIVHYLANKIFNRPSPINKINEVNLYKFHPESLATTYKPYGKKVKEWYFYTPRDRSIKNGTRPNRAAGGGYWKATGRDKPIISKKNVVDEWINNEKKIIGYRRRWCITRGRLLEDIRLIGLCTISFKSMTLPINLKSPSDMKLDDCVLCKIYKKSPPKTRLETDPSTSNEVIPNWSSMKTFLSATIYSVLIKMPSKSISTRFYVIPNPTWEIVSLQAPSQLLVFMNKTPLAPSHTEFE